MAEPRSDHARDAWHRVGRAPRPLDFPDWEYATGNRFDDPLHQYRCLYVASLRAGAFGEVISRYRRRVPLLEELAALGEQDPDLPEPEKEAGRVPKDFYANRLIGSLAVDSSLRFLDVEATQTQSAMRDDLATIWREELGLSDFDVAAIRGPWRRLTQAAGRWAFEKGYAGVRYVSRLNTDWELWAIFDHTPFAIRTTLVVRPDDPDLVEAARVLGVEP